MAKTNSSSLGAADAASEMRVYYNGFTGAEMYSPYGLQKLGIENVKPMLTRGILIDLAGYKNLQNLPARYEVTLADVRGALARQGLAEADLRPGDALLFRYGWSRFWAEPAKYNTDPPGIGLEVARWVVARKASMVGSDQWGTEVGPNPDPSLAIPRAFQGSHGLARPAARDPLTERAARSAG